jgi:hypothetical protein
MWWWHCTYRGRSVVIISIIIVIIIIIILLLLLLLLLLLHLSRLPVLPGVRSHPAELHVGAGLQHHRHPCGGGSLLLGRAHHRLARDGR